MATKAHQTPAQHSQPSFLFSASSTPTSLVIKHFPCHTFAHAVPLTWVALQTPPIPVQGKQPSVMEKRASSEARQSAVDSNLTWPLSSCVTWSMCFNLPVNRNGNASLPGLLGGLNNKSSEKQSLVPGECSMNTVIITISAVQGAQWAFGDGSPCVTAHTLEPRVLSPPPRPCSTPDCPEMRIGTFTQHLPCQHGASISFQPPFCPLKPMLQPL